MEFKDAGGIPQVPRLHHKKIEWEDTAAGVIAIIFGIIALLALTVH